ncbi:short-chain dehydrogenase [Aspergillus nomiae NRRL 13137]|uniref:Short-chain dehydrogenase n=1 Tax=Aspergillus nomiae NRRL (strain ATCC 15546 / NRRL 13137 / CBS 260.88 / M93) TaxID=1509407 RepID=A0A0L1J9N2_ASPN3|nr:short-chain dehydrogenase [Aspergillus nomiae NRRL 13137]KNG88444.1 short-chain dehydrogenase [Aspergillus nomiae NRRL 13137]
MSGFDFDTEGKSVVERWGSLVEGKVAVITGASEGGLGGATAFALASARPSHLVLLARTESKVRNVISSIKEISPGTQPAFVHIELDDLDSVRRAAADVLSITSKIDVLINNAGVMAIPWSKSKNGLEKTLGINHLGHFLLTKLLMPSILAAGPGSRIVNVTSAAYRLAPFFFDDWNFSDGQTYHPLSAYGQSKTANILFTVGLAQRYKKHGILSYAAHPGYVPGTSLFSHGPDLGPMDEVSRRNTGFPFGREPPKSLEQGISTTLVAALSPELTDASGAYMEDCQVCEAREYARDPVLADRLWSLSEELSGESF